MSGAPPSWRLPRGVNASLWEYAHTDWLAESEDGYFADHPLMKEDVAALDARFGQPGPLIDLGCGVGRVALHFARRGFETTAVDLSHAMVRQTAARARAEGVSLSCVRANLCRLDFLPAAHYAYAVMMFSTLGMVRTAAARQTALNQAARLLRPGGVLALHAHNLWLNLDDPQGRLWLLGQAPRIVLRRPGTGDRRMTYRGVPNMEVHLYRWPELTRSLRRAGLRVREALPIDARTARPIPLPWLWPGMRAGGWIVFAATAP